jgi:hypothetical protein
MPLGRWIVRGFVLLVGGLALPLVDARRLGGGQ